MITEYSAGLMFWKGEVVLIQKKRPAWQAGRLNAIGGHIEEGESPVAAMVREFKEETGGETNEEQWLPVCVLTGDGFKLHVFRTMGHLDDLRSTTDEEIVTVPCDEITVHNAVPNLTWIVPMARSLPFDRADSFNIQEVA